MTQKTVFLRSKTIKNEFSTIKNPVWESFEARGHLCAPICFWLRPPVTQTGG